MYVRGEERRGGLSNGSLFRSRIRWKGRRRKLESTFVVKYCRCELAAVPPQEGRRHAGTDVETVRVHVRSRSVSRVEVAERVHGNIGTETDNRAGQDLRGTRSITIG